MTSCFRTVPKGGRTGACRTACQPRPSLSDTNLFLALLCFACYDCPAPGRLSAARCLPLLRFHAPAAAGAAAAGVGTDSAQDPTQNPAQGDQSYTDEAGNVRIGAGKELPAWYPADPEHFTFYHDEAAPRVVDNADILSAQEEQKLESRLAQFRTELNRDLVIYTDTSSYGLGHDIMAADIFDFNGYGCTDQYEGACLFVCMDPNDRGFYTSAFGPDSRALYTYDAANELDDVLYDYFVELQEFLNPEKSR